MKKIVLSLMAVCGTMAAANAQGILVFGDVGYNSNSMGNESVAPGLSVTDEVKTSVFSFSPGIGYMINQNMAVGIQVKGAGTRILHTTDIPGSVDRTDRGFDLMVGPFFRYSMPINQTFFSYTQINVGYLTGTYKREEPTQDFTDKYNGFGAELYPAIGINVTPKMALSMSIGGIGYNRLKWDNELPKGTPAGFESHNTESNFDFNFGQQMNLTVQWTFGGKSKSRANRAPGDDYRDMRIDRSERRSNDDE